MKFIYYWIKWNSSTENVYDLSFLLRETMNRFKNGGRKRLRRIYTTNPPPPDASPRSLNLIKQLITNNNLIRPILDKVRNYILFNYVYPVHDRGSVLFDYRSREHSRINEEAVLFVFETLKPWERIIYWCSNLDRRLISRLKIHISSWESVEKVQEVESIIEIVCVTSYFYKKILFSDF